VTAANFVLDCSQHGGAFCVRSTLNRFRVRNIQCKPWKLRSLIGDVSFTNGALHDMPSGERGRTYKGEVRWSRLISSLPSCTEALLDFERGEDAS
jgi:hypothetical protein